MTEPRALAAARPRALLVVFAKWPDVGRVKTRMSPPLSPERAAGLYRCMLEDVLASSAEAIDALGLQGIVTLDPPAACPDLAMRVPRGFQVAAQRGADLARRMAHEVASGFARGAARVLLRGSDNPALGRETIEEALGALDDVDVAVAPDLDGGYGLVGLRVPAVGIFEHPMSTSSVVDDTLARAADLGLSTLRCTEGFDLDTARDLVHLERWRRVHPEDHRCRRTLAYLDDHDLWRLAGPTPLDDAEDVRLPRSR